MGVVLRYRERNVRRQKRRTIRACYNGTNVSSFVVRFSVVFDSEHLSSLKGSIIFGMEGRLWNIQRESYIGSIQHDLNVIMVVIGVSVK